MNEIKVSIIVPVYNAEDYLENCINSMLHQTYSDIEIVLINDGSTDSSSKIIDRYAKKDKRLKSIHIKNSGVSTARNIGLQNATGNWIVFVDSDDWIEPNMISFSVNKALETKADIVMWTYFKNYANEELALSLLPGGDQEITANKDLFHLKAIYQMYGEDKVRESVSSGTVWCKLYKKSLIEDNNLEFKVGLTRAQDTVFSLNAFEQANKIVYYDKSLYHYRITTTSTTSGTRFIENTKAPFDMLLDEFLSFVRMKNGDERYSEAFNGRTIQVIMWHLKHNYFHSQFRGSIFRKKREVRRLIEKEPYKTALEEANYNLLPKKEKLMAKMLKYKLIIGFYVIYKAHQYLEKRRTRRYK